MVCRQQHRGELLFAFMPDSSAGNGYASNLLHIFVPYEYLRLLLLDAAGEAALPSTAATHRDTVHEP